MVKVQLNKKTGNPFYGLTNCLQLYNQGSKGSISPQLLDACWKEVQEDKEKREMFFSLLFSIGDITARQHNIFKKNKVDSGGSSQRDAFRIVVGWMKDKLYLQFKKFMFAKLFNEFVSFDVLLANRVKTTKGKKGKPVVESVISSLSGSEDYINDLTDFVVSVIQGNNPADKHFVAKFLTPPRLTKRKGHKLMLTQTRDIMRAKQRFLTIVCEKASLPYVKKTTHKEFTGYIAWRRPYLGDIESVMFATGKIKEFDKDSFKDWLNRIPASARYRVRKRLLDKSDVSKVKWGQMGKWFLEWEKFKETKQTEVRVLEEKVRQGTASEDEKASVEKVKKEAKVTVGAVSFQHMLPEIIRGTIDKVKIQPFLDKVNLPYNNLVFIDDSGSMRANSFNGISAFDYATFMATICLTKNPDDVGRSMLGFYSQHARLYSTMTSRASQPNTILRGRIQHVSEPLIDPNKHFLENLQRIREFGQSVMTSNGTNISSIPDYLYRQLKDDSTMIEQLQNFPVWTIMTDGNFNNMGSPEASINDFMMKCQSYFGFKPFVIAIDVAEHSSVVSSRFSGIENFMMVPPNPGQIEQLLTNFRDIDIMDVYTPLQSFYRSNRYELVRKATI